MICEILREARKRGYPGRCKDICISTDVNISDGMRNCKAALNGNFPKVLPKVIYLAEFVNKPPPIFPLVEEI